MNDISISSRTTNGTIAIMAAACGVMVGNVYLCQPLLGQMAANFDVPERTSSFVAVATQIGYAIGILFLVPLSDTAEPRTLVRTLMALTGLGLFSAATAPNIPLLALASVFLAIVTAVPQMLIALATSLVPPERRGRAVGTMTMGLILGILLSRAVSGIVAEYSGTWRASYALAGVLVTILLFVVPNLMPKRPKTQAKIAYGQLLASLPALLRHRPLLLSMSLHFLAFGAFSAFWSTLAYHLATPAFGLGPAAVGLFGVWGAPGALLAPFAGRLSDRWGSARVNAFGFMAILAGLIVAGTFGAFSLIGIVAAVNLLDFGLQSSQIANQTRIFAIAPEIRGRLNTLYMTSAFSGASLGSLAGAYAWTWAGWTGVCILSGVLVCGAAAALGISILTAKARTPIVAG